MENPSNCYRTALAFNFQQLQFCEGVPQSRSYIKVLSMRPVYLHCLVDDDGKVCKAHVLRHICANLCREREVRRKWDGRNLREVPVDSFRAQQGVIAVANNALEFYLKKAFTAAGIGCGAVRDSLMHELLKGPCEVSRAKHCLEFAAIPVEFAHAVLAGGTAAKRKLLAVPHAGEAPNTPKPPSFGAALDARTKGGVPLNEVFLRYACPIIADLHGPVVRIDADRDATFVCEIAPARVINGVCGILHVLAVD